jgi:hypothetical protein
MRCVAIIAVFVLSPLFGQAPAPPPEVDKALRARVQEYYQDFVDGKFRKADSLVAEDSKDYFFAMEKTPFKGFDGPKSIVYSADFQKADVIMTIDTELRSPRLGTMRIRPEHASTWKVVDGQWYWYHVQPKFIDTPFGRRILPKDYDENNADSMHSLVTGEGKKPPGFHMVTPEELAAKIKVDKTGLMLSSFQDSSETVTVSNSLPGPVTVEVRGTAMPGLTIEPMKKDLKSGESVTIMFRYSPATKEPKSTLTETIHVEPLGQTFPLTVQFAVPRPVRPAGTAN